jgi:hypothetical protein
LNRAQWADLLQAACLLSSVALIAAAPLIPCESAATLGSHIVFAMLWLLVLVTWAFSEWLRPQATMRLGVTGIAVLMFVAVHAISALVMGAAGHARPALNMLWQYVAYAVAFLVIRQVARQELAVRAIGSSLVALSLGLASLGFYQYFISMPADVARFEKNPDAVLRDAGISAPRGSPERRQFADRIRSKEPNATFALANSLAGFLTPCLVLVVGLASWDRLKQSTWRLTAGALLFAAPLAGCLILTKSRSAFVGTAVGLLGVTIWDYVRRRLPRWPAWVGGLAGLGLLLLLATWVGGLDRQVITEAPKSLLYRMQYWRASVDMIVDYPALGCGPGNFKEYYTHYKAPEASESISDPHNFLLEIAATAGLPALLLFVCIGGAAVLQMRRKRPRGESASAGPEVSRIPTLVYCGLAVGIVVSVPLGMVSGFPVNLEMLLLLLPTGAAALWLLHRWVTTGQLATSVVAFALIALLVNLLAAGGIGYPGVGQLVWVLLALTINLQEMQVSASDGHAVAKPAGRKNKKKTGDDGRRPATSARGAVGLVLGFAALLLVACFITGYRPVLAAHQHLSSALSARDGRVAESELKAAAESDRWWSEPWELLAGLAFQRWKSSSGRSSLEEFESYVTKAQEADPQSSRLFRQCGDWWLEIFQRTRDADRGERAVAAYGRAVELYPNSGILHAQLAWALHLTGKDEESAAQAEKALALNRLTPHQEFWLQNLRLSCGPRAESAASEPPNAEQIMLKLRKSDKDG